MQTPCMMNNLVEANEFCQRQIIYPIHLYCASILCNNKDTIATRSET